MENESIILTSTQEYSQNLYRLKHMIEKMEKFKKDIETDGNLDGITKKVINKIFNNEEVIVCIKCKSPNAYRTGFELNPYSKNYHCEHCKEYFNVFD